jgi:hypothetical protein
MRRQFHETAALRPIPQASIADVDESGGTPMHRHQRVVSRPVSFILKSTIAIPLMSAVLFLAPAAGTEEAHAPNPDNVLVIPKGAGGWFGRAMIPAAEAAPRSAQRPQRGRAKSRMRAAPVAVAAAVSEPQIAESAWPDAAATVGMATLIPITVKTVREMVAPSPEAALVFANELSDIDLAARPLLTQPPPEASTSAYTDGHATPDNNVSEPPRVFAMTETMKAFAQSAWLEPVLLVLAGALAAFSALRLFA